VVGRLGGRLFSIGDADDDFGNVLAKELALGRGSHREHGEGSKARSVIKLCFERFGQDATGEWRIG
jgi:hypothetical protein